LSKKQKVGSDRMDARGNCFYNTMAGEEQCVDLSVDCVGLG
jgi:hypothetical protein